MEIYFFHITWVTHNTRVSERMKTYKVKLGKPVLLSMNEEAEIAGYIYEIVKKDKLRILSFNICVHYIHMIILCDINDRDNIVQKLKTISSKKYLDKLRRAHKPAEQGVMTPCLIEIPKHLWAQKYNWTCILSDE